MTKNLPRLVIPVSIVVMLAGFVLMVWYPLDKFWNILGFAVMGMGAIMLTWSLPITLGGKLVNTTGAVIFVALLYLYGYGILPT